MVPVEETYMPFPKVVVSFLEPKRVIVIDELTLQVEEPMINFPFTTISLTFNVIGSSLFQL